MTVVKQGDAFPVLGDAIVTLRRWAITLRDFRKDDSYSPREIATNKLWYDGRRIYRKVLHVPALPSNANLLVPHGIHYKEITSFTGIATGALYSFVIPYNDQVTASNSVRVLITQDEVQLYTASNKSAYSGKLILEYTKG